MNKIYLKYLAFLAALLITLVGFAGISSTFATDGEKETPAPVNNTTYSVSTPIDNPSNPYESIVTFEITPANGYVYKDSFYTNKIGTTNDYTDTNAILVNNGTPNIYSFIVPKTNTAVTYRLKVTVNNDTKDDILETEYFIIPESVTPDTATGIVNTGVTDKENDTNTSIVTFDVRVDTGSKIEEVKWTLGDTKPIILKGTDLDFENGGYHGKTYKKEVPKTEKEQTFIVNVTVEQDEKKPPLEYKDTIPTLNYISEPVVIDKKDNTNTSVVTFDVVINTGTTLTEGKEIKKVGYTLGDKFTSLKGNHKKVSVTKTGSTYSYTFEVPKTFEEQDVTVSATINNTDGKTHTDQDLSEKKGKIPAKVTEPTDLAKLKEEAKKEIDLLKFCRELKDKYKAKIDAVKIYEEKEIEKIKDAINTFITEEDLEKLFGKESIDTLSGALKDTEFTYIVEHVKEVAKEYGVFTGGLNATGTYDAYTGALKDYTGALDEYSKVFYKIIGSNSYSDEEIKIIKAFDGNIEDVKNFSDKLAETITKFAEAKEEDKEEAKNSVEAAKKDFETAQEKLKTSKNEFDNTIFLTDEQKKDLKVASDTLDKTATKLKEESDKLDTIKKDFTEELTKLKKYLDTFIREELTKTAAQRIDDIVNTAKADKTNCKDASGGGSGKPFDSLTPATGSTATGSSNTGNIFTGTIEPPKGDNNDDIIPPSKPTNEKKYCYKNVNFDFSDINSTFAKEYLKTLAKYGIITGYRDGKIHADRNTTRAEFLKIIFKAMCIDYSDANVYNLKYSDVRKNSWEAKVISKAVELGVVTDKKRKFRPTDNVSRIETLRIIFNAAGINVNNNSKSSKYFIDVRGWGAKYADTALDMGIIAGNKRFRPNTSISRAETSKMVVNSIVESDVVIDIDKYPNQNQSSK